MLDQPYRIDDPAALTTFTPRGEETLILVGADAGNLDVLRIDPALQKEDPVLLYQVQMMTTFHRAFHLRAVPGVNRIDIYPVALEIVDHLLPHLETFPADAGTDDSQKIGGIGSELVAHLHDRLLGYPVQRPLPPGMNRSHSLPHGIVEEDRDAVRRTDCNGAAPDVRDECIEALELIPTCVRSRYHGNLCSMDLVPCDHRVRQHRISESGECLHLPRRDLIFQQSFNNSFPMLI